MNRVSNIIKSGHDFSIPLICTWLLASCLTPVDIHTGQIGNKLVVSGQVSSIEDQNSIQLGRTASTARLPIPLSGGSITLLDDLGTTYSYHEDLSNPGTYILTGVSGIPGRTYHIQIVLSAGEVYESRPEKMTDSAGKISTHYEIAREEY